MQILTVQTDDGTTAAANHTAASDYQRYIGVTVTVSAANQQDGDNHKRTVHTTNSDKIQPN